MSVHDFSKWLKIVLKVLKYCFFYIGIKELIETNWAEGWF